MAHRGLVEDILGHVSLRVDGERALVRCRGRNEAGLRFTRPDDIKLVAIETGELLEPETGHRTPTELPIHTEVLRARPDVASVVHAHPPSVVVTTIAGLPLVPLVGAYNIPAMRLARAGIPTYPRSVLIATAELGRHVAAALDRAQAVTLRGHGLVSVGESAAAAVLCALHVDTLARLTVGVHRAGVIPEPISDADADALPDLGPAFDTDTLWRHHLACLAADGLDLEDG